MTDAAARDPVPGEGAIGDDDVRRVPGSRVNEVGIRLGSTRELTVCQVPPKLVSMPEVNGTAPAGLQPPPHQPA